MCIKESEENPVQNRVWQLLWPFVTFVGVEGRLYLICFCVRKYQLRHLWHRCERGTLIDKENNRFCLFLFYQLLVQQLNILKRKSWNCNFPFKEDKRLLLCCFLARTFLIEVYYILYFRRLLKKDSKKKGCFNFEFI